MTQATRVLQSHDLSEEGINFRSHTDFLTAQGHGETPRMRDQLNTGATCETTRTRKTIRIIHAPIHSNKANMRGWLWGPNDIRGPCGPKASWHLSYRWGEIPKKNLTQKTCPDQGSNRGRCVTGAHATACSTAVEIYIYICVYVCVLIKINKMHFINLDFNEDISYVSFAGITISKCYMP